MKFQKHGCQKPTHQEDPERESALTYIKNISTEAKRKYKIDMDHYPNKIQKLMKIRNYQKCEDIC